MISFAQQLYRLGRRIVISKKTFACKHIQQKESSFKHILLPLISVQNATRKVTSFILIPCNTCLVHCALYPLLTNTKFYCIFMSITYPFGIIVHLHFRCFVILSNMFLNFTIRARWGSLWQFCDCYLTKHKSVWCVACRCVWSIFYCLRKV